MFKPATRTFLAIALIIGFGCDEPVVLTPDDLSITPNSLELEIGESQNLVVRATAAGQSVPDVQITYSTANPAVATVDASGTVTGVGIGETTVSGSAAGLTVEVPVTVFEQVRTVIVSPGELSLEVGSEGAFTATALNNADQEMAVTFEWSSSSPAVASVDDGAVEALSRGTTSITASAGGVSDSAELTVTESVVEVVVVPSSVTVVQGATAEISVSALNAIGGTVADATFSFSSADEAIATVNTGGVITGVAVGNTTVTVTSDNVSTEVPVSVVAPVASLEAEPTTLTLEVGESDQVTITARNAENEVVDTPTLMWETTDSDVATVTGASPAGSAGANPGTVTAVGAGNATITASAGDVEVEIDITVQEFVRSVSVDPATGEIGPGETLQLSALARNAVDQVIPGTSFTWSSSDPAIATVNNTGRVTGQTEGTATIAASSGGVEGTATIDVVDNEINSIVVTPSPANVEIGGTRQLEADPQNQFGRSIEATVSWSSSNNAIATVNSSGLVSGVAAGTVDITATVDGVSTDVEVTVTETVASVEVTPTSTTVGVGGGGGTVQLTAVARNVLNEVIGGAVFIWASSDNAVATVNASGLVTGVTEGSVTITATAGSQSDDSAIDVVDDVVVVLPVTPSPAGVELGETLQLTADPQNQFGRSLGVTVTWTSSDNGIATVDNTGLVTPVSAGSVTITASAGGMDTDVSVSVTEPVASVEVTPATGTAGVGAGATLQLTAVARNALDGVIAGAVFTWTSSDEGVATVSNTGLVTGVTEGSVTITAASGGFDDTAAIDIVDDVAVTLDVSPSALGIEVGDTGQLTATAQNQFGRDVSGAVSWSTDDAGVATVSGTGLVTGQGEGSATITATAVGGLTDDVPVTVTEAIASVDIDPSDVKVLVGRQRQLTANARNGLNQVIAGVTFTWTSSNPAVATVNSTGRVTTLTEGTTTITAEAAGFQGMSTVVSTWKPNEPDGFTTITDRPFDAEDELGWQSFPRTGDPDDYIIHNDATAPQSPNNVGRQRFRPAAGLDGGEPVNVQVTFGGGQQFAQMYSQFHVKLSANWQGHDSGINKIFFSWIGNGTLNRFFLVAGGNTNQPLEIQALTQGTVPFVGQRFGKDQISGGWTGADPTMSRGDWHHVEVLTTNNTPGNADGDIHVWMNGIKIIEAINVAEWASGAENRNWQGFEWTPVWGGFGSQPLAVTQYMSIDHIYISGGN